MEISWSNLKISIAGARLSHLVRKDKIWDYGSMTQQVKNIFYQIQKAIARHNSELIRKYLTTSGFQQLDELINQSPEILPYTTAILTEVSIVGVTAKSNKHSDRFTALIKVRQKEDKDSIHTTAEKNFGIKNVAQQWYFVREGDWWLLDRIKPF